MKADGSTSVKGSQGTSGNLLKVSWGELLYSLFLQICLDLNILSLCPRVEECLNKASFFRALGEEAGETLY